MNKKYIILLLLLIIGACPAFSQAYNYGVRSDVAGSSHDNKGAYPSSKPQVSFKNCRAWISGDSLIVDFNYTLRGDIIGRAQALHLVPTYITEDKKQEVRFPALIINGRSRASYYRREQALLSHQEYLANRPYDAVIYDGKGPTTYHYRSHIRLGSSPIHKAQIKVVQYMEDCCDLFLISSEPIAISGVSSPEVMPVEPKVGVIPRIYESSVTFIRPEKEVVKTRNEHLILHINYIVDRSDILPGYANNAKELDRVDRVLRRMIAEKETYTLNDAKIEGYASPEAPFQYNLKLSQRRANGFRDYIINRYGLTLSSFPAEGKGEDWAGLRRSVSESTMPYRNEVLSIIDGVGIFNGREKRLMELGGGVPYKYMLKNFFPPLRRMEMTLHYTVRSFDTVEAARLIDDRPQDLSQEEIYSVAIARNKSRQTDSLRVEYGKEYDVAARYFPDDAIANINASSAALVRGNPDEAYEYLLKVKDDPRSYNNWGVYYWMKGNIAQAKKYFEKALTIPQSEARARYNLKSLEGLTKDQEK